MPNIVITGATQGIGKAIAKKFLSEGFDIAVCARTKGDLDIAMDEWRRQYPQSIILGMPADLSVKKEVLQFAEYISGQFSQVDVLVNNAGAFFPGKLADEPEGHLEKLMEINLYSAYHLTRSLLPAMKKARTGHIFNISSVAGMRAYENGGAYSITKYALLGFSDNLRMELMDDHIKVTALMPGATWSRSWEGSGLDAARLMQPEDIANMVWASSQLSPSANVDHIVIRPLKGDI
ncbi:MAG TPA: SDR family oxidoreductase [Flavipsychrobacter sp.]|nr:SDR family oxidoreductase [Flavipsychrobacter sp.]